VHRTHDDVSIVQAGGEDDLVSIWYFPARRLVARCEGHCGYVSSVHFEPRTAIDIACNRYRFASAGQDTNMLLWQFHERELDLEYDPASITDLMTVQREECYTKVPCARNRWLTLTYSLGWVVVRCHSFIRLLRIRKHTPCLCRASCVTRFQKE